MTLAVTQAIANNYPTSSVDFGSFPKGGQKVVTATVNFSATITSVLIDLSLAHTENKIEFVQAVYCDNSQNSAPVSLVVPVTNQVVSWPAYSQGWLPVAATNAFGFLANCTSGYTGNTIFQFANCPYPADVWSVGAIPVYSNSYDSNGNQIPSFINNLVTSGSTQTSGASVFNGTANKYTTVGAISISATGDATIAAAGEITVSISTSAGLLFAGKIYLPSAVPANPVPNYTILNMNGLQFIDAVTNRGMSCNLSSSLTSGYIYWTVNYGFTSSVP